MDTRPVVEFEHCRELALTPGSVFEFTSRFLQAGRLEPLLALYALRQAISSIPHGHVDDTVKWAKLKWWSEELVADPDASLRHPILRALWLSGARKRLDNALLLRLVSDAISQIDIAPDSDEGAMFERLAELGATEIQLELALDEAEIDAQSLGFLGAATGSFRLISSFAANHVTETAQLPLSVLAKHNVSATQLEQKSHMTELIQIITQLAVHSMNWFTKGLADLKMSPESSACSHLQLRWAMEKRRLNAIKQDVPGFLEAGKRYGPADAWFAWRFLRKLT
jgi:phytoene/squalene synthetase